MDDTCTCPICFIHINNSIKLTLCNHTFCVECIKKWIDTPNYTCPCCRSNIATKDFNIFRSDYLKIYVITFIVLSTALFIFFRIRTDSNLGFIPSKINFAKPLYLISFILISCPAVILSLQTTWWDRASISNTYLGVMVTEFGTALFLALVVNNVITKTVFHSKTKI